MREWRSGNARAFQAQVTGSIPVSRTRIISRLASGTASWRGRFYHVWGGFWEHLPATLLTPLALWQALEGHYRTERRQLVGAGIAIGAAAWLRNEAILAAPALIGAVLLTRRSQSLQTAARIGIGAGAGVLPLLLYNQIVFGAVVGPHVLVAGAAQYRGVSDPLMIRIEWADRLLVPLDEPVLAGLVIVLVIVSIITAIWRARSAANVGFALAIVVTIVIAAAIPLAPRGGLQTTLLMTFPAVLLCCFPVAPKERLDRVDTPLILTAFGLTLIALAWLALLPDGGAQWGSTHAFAGGAVADNRRLLAREVMASPLCCWRCGCGRERHCPLCRHVVAMCGIAPVARFQ